MNHETIIQLGLSLRVYKGWVLKSLHGCAYLVGSKVLVWSCTESHSPSLFHRWYLMKVRKLKAVLSEACYQYRSHFFSACEPKRWSQLARSTPLQECWNRFENKSTTIISLKFSLWHRTCTFFTDYFNFAILGRQKKVTTPVSKIARLF